ncbi:MAG: Rrf2 family transcriptional regulator [Polyangiaceae bacterium]|jgi:Rrf2 family protein
MKLSRASVYAFYGLTVLAEKADGGYVPLSEIHERYGVPEKHLAKIFQVLVKAGILESARGVNGGFALARPATTISPLDVVKAIEGPIDEAGCLLLQEKCASDGVCRINAVWRRAQHAMLTVLRQATLADMVGDPKRRLHPPPAGVERAPKDELAQGHPVAVGRITRT